MQVLASQLLFLANRNAGLAISPLLWPVNCIKIGGQVALLSDPTVNCLYCAKYFYFIHFHVFKNITIAINININSYFELGVKTFCLRF